MFDGTTAGEGREAGEVSLAGEVGRTAEVGTAGGGSRAGEYAYARPLGHGAVADFEAEAPFYLAFARKLGGPVLDLGCGTGRVTLALAQAGLAVTGFDNAAKMLARVREKAAGVGISWVDADVRTFALGQRFRLIIEPGLAFQLLRDRADQSAMLTQVRRHLAPGGRFVLNLDLAQAPHASFLAELQDLVAANGLEVTARYAGTDFSPLTATSPTIILVCKESGVSSDQILPVPQGFSPS